MTWNHSNRLLCNDVIVRLKKLNGWGECINIVDTLQLLQEQSGFCVCGLTNKYWTTLEGIYIAQYIVSKTQQQYRTAIIECQLVTKKTNSENHGNKNQWRDGYCSDTGLS